MAENKKPDQKQQPQATAPAGGQRPQQRPPIMQRRAAMQGGNMQAGPGGMPMPKSVAPREIDDTRIKEYLRAVKPRKSFRGVNEEDMWTIVANVQKFYQKEFETEKARFEAIIQEKDREIYNLYKKIIEK